MVKFEKEHEVLICLDSDGTVMDTMTIKHERSFGPKFLEVYHVTEHKEDILNHWLNTNLYAKTRGINRFQGLKEILEYMENKYQIYYEGAKAFYNWVLTVPKFSEKGLEEAIASTSDNNCMKLALEWSRKVNETIKLLPPSNAFEGVPETLKEFADKVDFLGVSSANKAAVDEEWTRLHLIEYFKEVGCQDAGSKAQIIADGLNCGYDKKHVIMVGDAIGDLSAAEKNGVYFFPIIPGKEVYSWKKLREEGINKMLNGTFDDNYQKAILDEFMNSLN